MWEYNYTNEMYHWGIPKMRWGERRYQNPDGTLTEEGKARYTKKRARRKTMGTAAGVAAGIAVGASFAKAKAESKEETAKIKQDILSMSKQELTERSAMLKLQESLIKSETKDAPDYDKIFGDTVKTVDSGMDSVIHNVQSKADAERLSKAYQEAGYLTDDELRTRINRMNLEKQYTDLTKSKVETGKDKTLDMLNTTKEVVNIAAGVGSAALIFYKLFGRKKD